MENKEKAQIVFVILLFVGLLLTKISIALGLGLIVVLCIFVCWQVYQIYKDRRGRLASRSLIIQYTNILHSHGRDSDEAKQFIQLHKDDVVFVKRAETLNKLFGLRS